MTFARPLFAIATFAACLLPFAAESMAQSLLTARKGIPAELQLQKNDRTMGELTAPVQIVEYASMTCPHCATFHTETFPAIKEKYIETGKVLLIFREMPWDPLAFAVSKLARCAPEDEYFQYLGTFFDTQARWARNPNPLQQLKEIAAFGGMNEEEVEACLKNQEIHDEMLAIKKTGQENLGVRTTPSFFINSQKIEGAQPLSEFEKVIDAELAKAAAQ